MGFMDKAKKLAEQAQQKLDEAQDSFNQGASPQHTPDARRCPLRRARPPDPRRDARPPPAPPPAAEPADRRPRSRRLRPTPSGDTNTNPDPFKPLQ